jgi:hypothetical protein
VGLGNQEQVNFQSIVDGVLVRHGLNLGGNMKAKVWNPVKPIMEAGLRPVTFQVAMFLWYHVGRNSSTYVSIATLAKETTLSQNSIRKAIHELRDKGIISIRSRQGYTNIIAFVGEKYNQTSTTDCGGTPTTNCSTPPTTDCTQSNKENQVEKKPSNKPPASFVAGKPNSPTLSVEEYKNPSTEDRNMTAEEILKKYGVKNGKITKFDTPKGKQVKPATLLSRIWRTEIPSNFPDISFIPAFTKKQLGMFSLFAKRVGYDNYEGVMTFALRNWKPVVSAVKANVGLPQKPQQPTIDFILKYCGEITQQYHLATNKPKPIPAPASTIKKPSEAKFSSAPVEEDLMTLDKIATSKYFKEV